MWRKYVLLSLIIMILFPVFLRADTTFADLLYNQKDYRSSVLEYKRILYSGQVSSEESVYVARQIVYALFQNKDLQELREFAQQNQALLTADEFGSKLTALADIKQGYYFFATRGLAGANQPESLVLRGVANHMMNQTEEARKDFAKALEAPLADPALLASAINIETDLKQLPRKSPFLAGTLAIVPGFGYAYTGRWETALSSLILNGMLIMASAELYQKDLFWSAGILSSVALGFYLGNIYGSAAAAAQDNFETRKRFLEGYIDLNSSSLLNLQSTDLQKE